MSAEDDDKAGTVATALGAHPCLATVQVHARILIPSILAPSTLANYRSQAAVVDQESSLAKAAGKQGAQCTAR